MQFRWNVRKPITVPVMLYHHVQPPLHVKTRNISLGGMFIEVDPHALAPNASVEVSFTPQTNSKAVDYRIQALVVRVTDEGAGLMFHGSEADGIRFLQDVMARGERRRQAGAGL